MFDYNEQQVSGDEPKSEQSGAKDASSTSSSQSCGNGQSRSWDSCPCEGDASTTETSSELVFSRPSEPAYTETVFAEQADDAFAADINAPAREALWESLVQSQRPEPARAKASDAVARNPMQWTLVDLSTSACDKPGCDPETCDSADCDTTDAYDRSEYETPEYATSGYVPAVAFNADEPSPAPTAYVPPAVETPKPAGKSKKAAAAKEAKAPKAKKAKSIKAGGKKAAPKKPAAKKTVKTAGAKKTAKKATTARSKKAAAKTSLPLTHPSSDPHFPRVQAA